MDRRNGNRTQMVDLAGTNTYQYDPLYRLTQVTYPTPQTDTYTYDPVGNRLTKNATSYNYDAADQMTNAGGVSYGYDPNGNQASAGSDTFDCDHENRLVESVIDSVTSTSVYNGDGLRMSHTVGQTTTSYIWDVASGLPVVLQDGTNTYVYGLDLISATDGQGDQTYFLYDGLGSTTGLADGSGNVTASYGYDVFGALRSGSPGANPWLFTGEQRDADSELYYLRARYYDPDIGRFLGQDPLPAVNLYAYVGNNPANLVDPSGLCIFGAPCPDIPVPPPPPNPIDLVENIVECAHNSLYCLTQPAEVYFTEVVPWSAGQAGHALPYISRGVQTADLVPWGAIPGFNVLTTLISVPLDLAAFGFAEYEAVASPCSFSQTANMTVNNVANLAAGVGGQLGSVLVSPTIFGSPVVAFTTSAFETTLYVENLQIMEQCDKE